MLLALLLAASAPWAAEYPAVMGTRPNLPFALVTGQIDENFSQRLVQLLDNNPQVQLIEIESYGGLANQAYRAAQVLNQRGIAVMVRGRCASACAYLWASANGRSLMERARIGVHSGRPAAEPPLLLKGIVKRRNSNLEFEALTHAGFPHELIAKIRATPPESMLWLTPSDLQAAGVKFQFVTGPAPNNSFKSKPLRGST